MEVDKSKNKVSEPDQEGKRRKTTTKGKDNKAKFRRVRKGEKVILGKYILSQDQPEA